MHTNNILYVIHGVNIKIVHYFIYRGTLDNGSEAEEMFISTSICT